MTAVLMPFDLRRSSKLVPKNLSARPATCGSPATGATSGRTCVPAVVVCEKTTKAFASRAFLRSAWIFGTDATQAGRGVQMTVVMSRTRSAVVGASTVTATASGTFGTTAPLGAGDGVGAGVGDGEGAVVADAVGAVVAPPVPACVHAAARVRLNASASVRRNIPHLSAKDRRTRAILGRAHGGLAKTQREHADDVKRDLRAIAEDRVELAPADCQAPRVAARDEGRRARLAGDERDLAHVLAWSASRDLFRAGQHAKRATHDDEQAVASIAFAHDDRAICVELFARDLRDLIQIRRRERSEEGP